MMFREKMHRERRRNQLLIAAMIKPAASDITELLLSQSCQDLSVEASIVVNLGSAVPCELYLGPAIINLVIGLNQSKSDQILE